MTWLTGILTALPQILKLITMVVEGLRKTPAEKRREALSQLDKAIDKSKKGDLKELSQWFGKRL